MKIKFTRCVLHKGEHQEQGSVAALPDGEAAFFIHAGDAVKFEGEEKTKPAKDEK